MVGGPVSRSRFEPVETIDELRVIPETPRLAASNVPSHSISESF
jgi:hypothetical protein